MIAYHHAVIAHGKAIAECLSERRPLSDRKYRSTFHFVESPDGRWTAVGTFLINNCQRGNHEAEICA